MADKTHGPKLAELQGLQASLDRHRRAEAAAFAAAKRSRRRSRFDFARLPGDLGQKFRRLNTRLHRIGAHLSPLHVDLSRLHLDPARLRADFARLRGRLGRRSVRRLALVAGAGFAVIVVSASLLWWRLMSGPISLDLATPWLAAAIEQNLGSEHRVEVGGTVLERDENGRTALRIRDIRVRDADGALVASAPRAEVGLSGWSLLTGHLRARSLNLVGAQISVRIETDGQLTVFAGAEKRPLATTPAVAKPAASPEQRRSANAGGLGHLAALLTWIDSLGTLGLDGHDLAEIGVKNGNLVVEDQRNGKRLSFENINLSLTRPRAGEVALKVGSDNRKRPWVLAADVRPSSDGGRSVGIEARDVSLRDVLLALRVGEDQYEADLPVSASLRAQIGRDGQPEYASGRLLAGPGTLTDVHDPDGRIPIDRAEFTLDWDAARRALAIPFQILSGGNRITLVAQAEAPAVAGGPWMLGLSGGTIMLAPLEGSNDSPLLINRIMLRGRLDQAKHKIELYHGDIGGKGVSFALSGAIDYSGSDPRIAIGIAAQNMTASAFKRVWPVFVSSPVRAWVLHHVESGQIDRIEIATNAPYSTLKWGGPPIPDDGLSVRIVSHDTVIRPVDSLPEIRNADMVTNIQGRTATITMGHGVAETSPGHRLTISDGVFQIPDTQIKPPQSRVSLRIEGSVPAAAELLSFDRLRDASGTPLDPATSHGNVTAQVKLAMPVDPNLPKGVVKYSVDAEVTNFAVDHFMKAQKVEASSLRIVANNEGYVARGDVRIGGIPASVEYRKPHGAEAEVQFQGTFDDAARARLGYDLYGAVTGAVPIKLRGQVASTGDGESRFAVEADLTRAKIDNLLPGWVKPAGKPSHAMFTLVSQGKSTRFEDLVIEGSGAMVKGTVDVDADGSVEAANFPVFGLADGDKASLKAERKPDGTLKVSMRGDVYDGRGFVKSSLGGAAPAPTKGKPLGDLDLDVKLGAVTGFHGEALRALDLHLSRRAGRIRAFTLHAKVGREATLTGDLRGQAGGHQVVYFDTKDAGALFRFTDTYSRIIGGQMWVAMDPPSEDQKPQDGLLNIRNFSVRGEPALERVAGSAPGSARNGVEFSRLRVDFTRSPGKLTIRDGVVRGAAIGATIDGVIDYAANDVRLRGTFVPLYGINNAFGQIPIVGLFLGGDKEGLVGITYEVVGPPGASVLRVNPISAVAPGLLRKLFEFPSPTQRGVSEQTRSFSDANR